MSFNMISVKDDWTWVVRHVDEALKDDKLYDDVYEYMTKYRIDLDRVKELYLDGITHGSEDGKYLSFSDWFYEFRD